MNKIISKKEWRQNIDACWNVQNKLQECLNGSPTFKSLDNATQNLVKESTGKRFILEYLNFWVLRDVRVFSANSQKFYNTDSVFWQNSNSTDLVTLNTECSLFSVLDCCKEKYNLQNLKGNYNPGLQDK